MEGVTVFGIGFWELVILAVVVGLPSAVIAAVLLVLLLSRRRMP
jgi:hypothetical protein